VVCGDRHLRVRLRRAAGSACPAGVTARVGTGGGRRAGDPTARACTVALPVCICHLQGGATEHTVIMRGATCMSARPWSDS